MWLAKSVSGKWSKMSGKTRWAKESAGPTGQVEDFNLYSRLIGNIQESGFGGEGDNSHDLSTFLKDHSG